MNHRTADVKDIVRTAVLLAFGEISQKTGAAPTHLDMRLRLDSGVSLHVYRTPIVEGGTGRIEVENPADVQS